MAKYEILDCSSAVEEVMECKSHTEAMEKARAWMREGYEQDDETTWHDFRVSEVDGEWEDWGTITVEALEPHCVNGHEHAWHSPYEIVGGIKDNPGVWGHGGGVIIHEVCKHCGIHKRTDTWATRPDTGEQGLESVTYTNVPG